LDTIAFALQMNHKQLKKFQGLEPPYFPCLYATASEDKFPGRRAVERPRPRNRINKPPPVYHWRLGDAHKVHFKRKQCQEPRVKMDFFREKTFQWKCLPFKKTSGHFCAENDCTQISTWSSSPLPLNVKATLFHLNAVIMSLCPLIIAVP